MTPDRPDQARARAYKRIIWTIALGIAVLAGAQAAWALSIGSRQLLKDASDWIYDVVLYGIAAFTFGRGAAAERGSALVIAAIMAAGGLHTLYDLWDKVVAPRPIEIAGQRRSSGNSPGSIATLTPIPSTAQSGGRASIRTPPTLRSSIQTSFGHLTRQEFWETSSIASQIARGTASGSSE
jgi:hypothetical protein